ncbi:hypothetical protein ABZ016_19245 [Streptomyces sp. NPDC006372]|uniref:hypothetical protein n=1 Tax=Streptomyces sp. NPDC006372 TaxID=3155599 RepID=UPI0033BF92B3
MTEPPSGSPRDGGEPPAPPTALLLVLAVTGGAPPILLGGRSVSGRPSHGLALPRAAVHHAMPVRGRRTRLPRPARPGPRYAGRADLAAPGMNDPRATGIDLP